MEKEARAYRMLIPCQNIRPFMYLGQSHLIGAL